MFSMFFPTKTTLGLLQIRIAIINATYSKDEARRKVLETLAWSMNALSISVANIVVGLVYKHSLVIFALGFKLLGPR